MKQGSKWTHAAAQAAIWLPGALGMGIVWRTASYYAGADPLAFWLVVAMGLGLAAGLVELSLRARAALQLHEEVRALPATPSDATVDATSPTLRAFLRARIEHAPAPGQPALLTPYLIGLLVMLGLLGTFMGLFETLRGAGQALTASSDLSALRAGLADPMSGLTRSFGSSAAGVCTSAMLGLAAVFARRQEGRTSRAVHEYCTGPLRTLSPLRRQLAALDRLNVQGEAWPTAAQTLQGVANQLDQLASRWEQAHAQAVRDTRSAWEQSAQQLGAQLQTAARQAAASTRETVVPLIDGAFSDLHKQSAEHLSELRTALRADQAARREADGAMRKEQTRDLREARTETESQLASLRQASTDQLAGLQDAARAVAQQSASAANELAEQVRTAAQARQEREDAQLQTLRSATELFERTAQEQAHAAAERWQQWVERMDSLQEAASQADGARLEQVKDVAQALQAQLAERSDAISRQLSQRAELDAAQASQAHAAFEQLEGSARAMQEQGASQVERWTELTERAQAAQQQALQQWQQAQHAHADALAGQAERLAAQTAEQAERVARASETQVRDVTEALAQQAESSASAQQQASEAQQAGLDALLETLRAQSGQLDGALGRQAELLEATLSSQTERLAEAEDTLRKGHESTVQALRESLTAQAERLQATEAGLQQIHETAAERLAEQLSGHARQLGDGLGASDKLIQDAAETLKASSVEMGAVAEMFAAAVDRQRDAAQTWLDSLGEIEGVVEQAGRGAAADALGDQLASTQEVFARQLQFQRELFDQLRVLRGGQGLDATAAHSQGARGDVSA